MGRNGKEGDLMEAGKDDGLIPIRLFLLDYYKKIPLAAASHY